MNEREVYEYAAREGLRADYPEPKRRGPRHNLRAGIVALLILLAPILIMILLGSVLRVVSIGHTVERQAGGPPPEARAALKQFMHAMDLRDTARAYALCDLSEHPLAFALDLDEWTRGANHALFEGYRGLRVGYTLFVTRYDFNPDHAGQFVVLAGTIQYRDGPDGDFSARLMLRDGVWRLQAIDIDVPPSRIEQYLERHRADHGRGGQRRKGTTESADVSQRRVDGCIPRKTAVDRWPRAMTGSLAACGFTSRGTDGMC